MNESISKIFKGITALIWVIPGLAYFKGDIYPANISKELLLAAVEISGGIIILILTLKKDAIKQVRERKFLIIIITLLILTIFESILFSYFFSQQVSDTNNTEKVLIPTHCAGRLCNFEKIAKEKNLDIGEYLGKTATIKVINEDCKKEIFYTQLIFFALCILLIDSIITLFISLALRLEKVNI